MPPSTDESLIIVGIQQLNSHHQEMVSRLDFRAMRCISYEVARLAWLVRVAAASCPSPFCVANDTDQPEIPSLISPVPMYQGIVGESCCSGLGSNCRSLSFPEGASYKPDGKIDFERCAQPITPSRWSASCKPRYSTRAGHYLPPGHFWHIRGWCWPLG